MLYGIGISGTGAHIEGARMENLASNLANLRTPGFKRELMTLMQRPAESADILTDDEAAKFWEADPLLDRQGGGVHLSDIFVDTTQGALEQTGNDLDFALQGQGYFTLEHLNHGRVYSRAGNFTLNAAGEIVTQDGSAWLLDDKGKRLNFNQLAANLGASGSKLGIGPDGAVTVLGAQGGSEDTGRKLGLAAFAPEDERKLEKLGHTFLAPRAGETVAPVATRPQVRQGMLEMSSSDPALLMTEMVEVNRLYEANLRMIRLQDATLATLIGRVGELPA